MLTLSPDYFEGDAVEIDWPNREEPSQGIIRGKSAEHLITFWIVEFYTDAENPDPEGYPFSCCTVPHTMLRRVG